MRSLVARVSTHIKIPYKFTGENITRIAKLSNIPTFDYCRDNTNKKDTTLIIPINRNAFLIDMSTLDNIKASYTITKNDTEILGKDLSYELGSLYGSLIYNAGILPINVSFACVDGELFVYNFNQSRLISENAEDDAIKLIESLGKQINYMSLEQRKNIDHSMLCSCTFDGTPGGCNILHMPEMSHNSVKDCINTCYRFFGNGLTKSKKDSLKYKSVGSRHSISKLHGCISHTYLLNHLLEKQKHVNKQK